MGCRRGARGRGRGRARGAGLGHGKASARWAEWREAVRNEIPESVLILFTSNAPQQRKSGCTKASQAPLQAPGRFLPSLPSLLSLPSARPYDCPAPCARLKSFPPARPPSSPQRSSLEESQRSTRTERTRCVSPRHALGESPRTSVFAIALSATNRHRSSGFHHRLRRLSASLYPPALLSIGSPDAAGGGAGTWMMTRVRWLPCSRAQGGWG